MAFNWLNPWQRARGRGRKRATTPTSTPTPTPTSGQIPIGKLTPELFAAAINKYGKPIAQLPVSGEDFSRFLMSSIGMSPQMLQYLDPKWQQAISVFRQATGQPPLPTPTPGTQPSPFANMTSISPAQAEAEMRKYHPEAFDPNAPHWRGGPIPLPEYVRHPTFTPTPTPTRHTDIAGMFQDPLGQMIAQITQQYSQFMTGKPYTTEQEQAILAQQDRAVEERYNRARQDLMNRLAAMGISPTSGEALSMLQQLATQEAAEKAGFRRQLGISEIQELQQRPLQALQTLMNLEQLRSGRIAQMLGFTGPPPTETTALQTLMEQLQAQQAAGTMAEQMAQQIMGTIGGLGGAYMQAQMQQQQMLPLTLLMMQLADQPYMIPYGMPMSGGGAMGQTAEGGAPTSGGETGITPEQFMQAIQQITSAQTPQQAFPEIFGGSQYANMQQYPSIAQQYQNMINAIGQGISVSATPQTPQFNWQDLINLPYS
jgi:hypothetical protein